MWHDVASQPAHEWWDVAEDEAAEIAFIGKRATSLSCATRHSERNWKDYKYIHSLSRNKLKAKRAEDMVYCYHNLRLLRKRKARAKQGSTYIPWARAMEDSDSE